MSKMSVLAIGQVRKGFFFYSNLNVFEIFKRKIFVVPSSWSRVTGSSRTAVFFFD